MSPRPCLLLAGVILAGCGSAGLDPAVGTVFVGATEVTLRKELAPRAPVTATVRHGERLELLALHRRFAKVRTEANIEGWTDGYALLTEQQMADFEWLIKRAASLPSQGKAVVYDALNMHIEPSRQSPTFHQVPPDGEVDIVGHKITPRRTVSTMMPISAAIVAKPAPARKPKSRKKEKASKLKPLAPAPLPPPPPENWLELSRTVHPAPEPVEDQASKVLIGQARPSNPFEDWSLVRTKDGKVGWVLFRMLSMQVPEEILGYAQGHLITSWFPIGEVRDGDLVKTHWFWTTIDKGRMPYEFDAVRIFVWNVRRHRYETGFSERNLRGYYPVEVYTTPERGFSIVIEETDGRLVRKSYVFNGFRARLVQTEDYQQPAAERPPSMMPTRNVRPQPEVSWTVKAKQAVRDLRRRVFGAS
jgi:hypothetical protein